MTASKPSSTCTRCTCWGYRLSRVLEGIEAPRILDVATGTGRLATALKDLLPAETLLVGIDGSLGMLHCSAPQVMVQADAQDLCLADDTFDCVCCLEALEFMPNADRALREMLRVAEPGGLAVVDQPRRTRRLVLPGSHRRSRQTRATSIGPWVF